MENDQMKPVILFRQSPGTNLEYKAALDIFGTDSVFNYRHGIPPNSLVIPRYSALPYYEELVADLNNKNCKLINSRQQHYWIAGFFDWQTMLAPYTFPSWNDLNFHSAPEGKYVVKGVTNSKKHQWNRLMFAKNKIEALNIAADLKSDSLIQSQDIVYRKFLPLKTLEVGVNELPITDEWRFFFSQNQLLSCGYYWEIADKIPNKMDQRVADFAHKIANIIESKRKDLSIPVPNFYVLDIALQENGMPILVEINDGSMSGLSCCNAHELYLNLKKFTSNVRC